MGIHGREMHVSFVLKCLTAVAITSFLVGPIVVRTAMNYAYNNYTLGPCNFTDREGFASACDFDLHYPEGNLSMFNWELGCGEGAFWAGGPPVDNNSTAKGGYAFMDLSRMSSDETGLIHRAWLPTHLLNATSPKGKCLRFSYSIDGLSVGGFRILVNATDVTYTIWETKDSTGGEWESGKVSFTCETPYRLVMEAFPRETYLKRRGYVAVDDFHLVDGFCGSDCTFEHDFCNWTNSNTSDEFDWKMGRGSSSSVTGPSRDHGSSVTWRETGGYAYIDSAYPNRPGDKAQLWSPVLNQHGNGSALCLSFWTSLYGSGVGALRVYMYDNTTNATGDPIWELYSGTRTPDQWYKGEVPLSLPRPFRVIFEAEINLPGESDIAIDDIALNNGSCPSIPREASKSGDCAFIVDSCGWREMDTKTRPESPPMWGRVTGDGTVLSPDGHTSMAGVTRQDSYMMFNTASYQHAPLDKGQLISPEIPHSNFTYCFSFWTYMYSSTAGVPIGGLVVKLKKHDNTTVNLWRLDNHQASHWVFSQMPLPAHLNVTERLIIEAIKGGDTRAAIAVDDITFTTPHNCTVKPAKASVHLGDCAFDRELCGWQVVNSSATGPKWRLPAGNTKPATVKDHTYQVLGDGFVYMDIFSAPSPISSTLQSPTLYGNPNITYCLSFWYLALETEEGASLMIKALFNNSHQEVWKLSRDTTLQTHYNFGQVNMTIPANFTVAFVSTVQKSGWVLDDIKFSAARISNVTTCALRPPRAKIE
ncbi:MAM and LDL-receptor class A domain-containing protein 1 [Parasteatoda tepidariorum]|uniref:MAM and LDL-receptor class A domain-containing protein 1 n=1 Tax=Parasteatoda tepidariorum TaxID=114398 RepID=UPI001C71F55B|nr:MAM and LDL-receptor class A domain-containing protein 1 isoform X1 [Parasteatoda tepidariorum]XP_042902865.1 MAM and LDL-receptor class A domain-containing protein 1 isoform X1 [Parasteatoda tepidariorum]XP_042902866.1 MAM and LDL-receptor class A domain-containing protein 1 isoform X1 [Parasteatoda tepidariorum]XP_042902867.1 MAM and LDL-receptor class A domain-containing protein 1 isoform X1 [Parasteatoda tepidariorum]